MKRGDRVIATLEGRAADRPPFMPITMQSEASGPPPAANFSSKDGWRAPARRPPTFVA
ncbi:MAG TPA: hypothetical protein VMV83_08065 [Rectinemataceae bacterium]|nr:hypothetical protein [Rectinemataceae bacterium]